MIEVKVPVLPESISEATVAVWHKKPGDFVELDDVIVEIETDKVVLEVPAEDSGVLTEIRAKEGETVGEQQVLGIMEKKPQDDSILRVLLDPEQVWKYVRWHGSKEL